MIKIFKRFSRLKWEIKNIIIITDDNCQYWKNLDHMTLSSPNYPKWYNADGVGCEWLMTAPEGFIIALEFNHFHVSKLLAVVILLHNLKHLFIYIIVTGCWIIWGLWLLCLTPWWNLWSNQRIKDTYWNNAQWW